MIADKKQQATQYGGMRPYGVAIMLAGTNKGKGHLYTTDVTGTFYAYKANAIGEHDEKIKEELRKNHKETMTMEQGTQLALKIFKNILEKNYDPIRFEVTTIPLGTNILKRHTTEAISKY